MKSDAIRRFNFGTVPTKMLSTFSFLLVVAAVDVVISLFGEKKNTSGLSAVHVKTGNQARFVHSAATGRKGR